MIDTVELRKQVEAAQRELAGLCNRKPFRMCIPVQPGDSDIVIGNGISAAYKALAEVERLQEETCKAVEELRHLKDDILQDPAAVRLNILNGRIKIPADLVWLHDDYGPVADLRRALCDALGGVK